MHDNIQHAAREYLNAPLPADVLALPSWLIWRYEHHPGEAKPRKVPYYVDGGIRRGQQGTPAERAKLVPYDVAARAAKDAGYTGVGLAMLADNGLVALDFDNCINDAGAIDPTVETLVAGTYAERSPSGKGVRAFMRGALKDRKDREAGFEVFHGSGFVTVTGDLLPDCALYGADVVPITEPVRLHYAARFGRAEAANDAPQDQTRLGLTEGKLRDMLARLDPSCGYEPWVKTGMALHHESGGQPYGLDLWDAWSVPGGTYPGRELLEQKWDSFGRARDRVTTANYLIHEAGGATADDFEDATPNAGQRFKLKPISDLIRRVLDSDYHIKHVLDHAALGVLYGESTAGKTFAALDMGLHVATGRAWRGHRVKQGRVVYVCTEGAEGFNKRLAALCRHYELDDVPDLRVIDETPSLLNDDHTALAEAINAWGNVRLIYLDTWSRAIAGGDENASDVVTKAVARATKLARATGAMVILVAHSGKDQTKGVRGHSSLKGSADVQIEILREGEGVDTRRSIRLEKVKDGPNEGRQYGFKLHVVDLGIDQDGDPVTSCVVVEGEKPAPKGTRKMGENESAALDTVRALIDLSDTGQVPVADAKAALAASDHFAGMDSKHRRDRVSTALDALEKRGAIQKAAGLYTRG